MFRKPLAALVLFSILGSGGSLNPGVATNEYAPRKVSLTILIDRELLEKPGAASAQAKIEAAQVEAYIRKIVAHGSEVYGREFGITFVIEAMKPWDFPVGQAEINGGNALDDAVSIADEESTDVTIGVVKKPLFICRAAKESDKPIGANSCKNGERAGPFAGYAYIPGEAAVIAIFPGQGEGVFIHEMGHIFGAEHTNEDSIMNDNKISKSFDAKNRDIILRNRNRTFEKTSLP
ncbi:MAG: M12 family metallo-peptidase [Candidatus Sungiibacteriota bacterium]